MAAGDIINDPRFQRTAIVDKDGKHTHVHTRGFSDPDVTLGATAGAAATPVFNARVTTRADPAGKLKLSAAEKGIRRIENRFIYGTAASATAGAAATAALSAGAVTAGSVLGATLTTGITFVSVAMVGVFVALSLVQRKQRQAAGI